MWRHEYGDKSSYIHEIEEKKKIIEWENWMRQMENQIKISHCGS